MADLTVLFLGPGSSPVLDHLRATERNVVATADPITVGEIVELRPDFAVSHGYRHIVRHEVLALLPDRVVNLHISFLPWNRGADPNVWSWVDDTPKGVTIHYMDEGLDTGDVIAQREVEFAAGETLRSSYERLQAEMLDLFVAEWPRIREGTCGRVAQQGSGSLHRSRDLERIRGLLTAGWDTPVAQLGRR